MSISVIWTIQSITRQLAWDNSIKHRSKNGYGIICYYHAIIKIVTRHNYYTLRRNSSLIISQTGMRWLTGYTNHSRHLVQMLLTIATGCPGTCIIWQLFFFLNSTGKDWLLSQLSVNFQLSKLINFSEDPKGVLLNTADPGDFLFTGLDFTWVHCFSAAESDDFW